MADGVLVDLPGEDQPLHIGAQGGTETAVVLPHVLPAVRLGAAAPQVQRGAVVPADAAQPGGKAVDDGGVVQRFGGVEHHAAAVMLNKGHQFPPCGV